MIKWIDTTQLHKNSSSYYGQIDVSTLIRAHYLYTPTKLFSLMKDLNFFYRQLQIF